MDIVLFVVTLLLEYGTIAVFVGISFSALSRIRGWTLTGAKTAYLLLGVFFLLDNLYTPLLLNMDILITIRNQSFSKVLELSPNYPLSNMLGPDFFDFVIYGIQILIALYVGERLLSDKSIQAYIDRSQRTG